MAQVVTDLRTTKERAGTLRFEQSGPILATNVQGAIEMLVALGIAPSPTPVNATPYTLLPTDYLLEINVPNAVINPGSAAARNGVPIFLKDITGNANAAPHTFNATVETVVGPKLKTDFGIRGFYPSGGNWRFRT